MRASEAAVPARWRRVSGSPEFEIRHTLSFACAASAPTKPCRLEPKPLQRLDRLAAAPRRADRCARRSAHAHPSDEPRVRRAACVVRHITSHINLYSGNVCTDGCISDPPRRSPARTGWSRRSTSRTALFAERGYAAVTMDEVAAAVGVTKPLLYNYFGNKERLYIACMERAGDALIGDGRRGGRRDRQPRRRARRRRPRLLRLPRHRPRRLGGALRRDPARTAARSPSGSPTTAAGSSTSSPTRCWRSCRAAPRRGRGRSRGPLHRPARRRRGARPLVAAHRGDHRRARPPSS